MIPVDYSPKSERGTLDLREELDARCADRENCLGNRVQIALIENELDQRANGISA